MNTNRKEKYSKCENEDIRIMISMLDYLMEEGKHLNFFVFNTLIKSAQDELKEKYIYELDSYRSDKK